MHIGVGTQFLSFHSFLHHLPPRVVTGGWSEINVHAETLPEPHTQVIVAQKRLRRVTLKQRNHVSV